MPAIASALRFYVDESAMGLGKTLAAARNDTIHCGHALVPECPLGTPDTEWMPRIAERGWVVIGRDKRIRSRPGERELLRDHQLRVFRIGGAKDLPTWEWLKRFTRYWDDMEQIIADRPDGPWFYLVNANGLREVHL